MEKEKSCVLVTLRKCVNKGPVSQTYNILSNIEMPELDCKLFTLKSENETDSTLYKFQLLPIQIVQAMGSLKDHLAGIFMGKGKIVEAMLSEKPDVIHTTGIVVDLIGMQAARRSGCKHIVTIRNYVYDDYLKKFGTCLGHIIAWIHLTMMRRAPRNTRYVCCSQSLAQMYKDRHKIDMMYIRNGVDINRFEPNKLSSKNELRKQLGLPEDKEIYITVGQVIPRKNISETIRVFMQEEFRDKLFVVVGAGSELNQLKEEAKSAENILFVGNQRNVEEWLKASDVFISSSKSEGLPNSVIEAMAMSLPVILSDIDQHKEIYSLNNQIGEIYTLGNECSLVQVLEKVNAEWIWECGKESYSLAHQELSAKRMSLEYQELYRTI